LGRKPSKAAAFYGTLAASAVLGMIITLTPLDPIKALYWSAVINGIVAVPVMAVMMLITAQRKVMGNYIIGGWLRRLGWAAVTLMARASSAWGIGWFNTGQPIDRLVLPRSVIPRARGS